MTLREAMRRTVEVKAYQWFAILLSLTIMWAGGIYGIATYIQDQRDQQRAEVARASYEAAIARYENARDEHLRCTQRAESAKAIRDAFLSVYDLIDELSPGRNNTFTTAARAQLNDGPQPDLADCPAPPIRPVPPKD